MRIGFLRQPGDRKAQNSVNRSTVSACEIVETVSNFLRLDGHRAEAAVLMRVLFRVI